MSRETTYAGTLGDWQRLLVSLKANGEDLGHLQVPLAKLEALLAQAVEINQEQAARKAAKQEASQQLRKLIPDGRRLATFLRQGLREHYGIRAEKLAEFGLQPFRGRSRAAKPEGPELPAPSPPSPPLEATDSSES